MDTVATHLEMIDGRLGGDFGVDDFGVPELAYPCVFEGVNDEGVTAMSVALCIFKLYQIYWWKESERYRTTS